MLLVTPGPEGLQSDFKKHTTVGDNLYRKRNGEEKYHHGKQKKTMKELDPEQLEEVSGGMTISDMERLAKIILDHREDVQAEKEGK